MSYAFISYAHKDKKYIENSILAFDAYGLEYWYDGGIEAGADWAKNIGSKLESASIMLLFLSKASVKSKNVRREIAFASEHKIPIITVQIGKLKIPDDLQKELTVHQFVLLGSYKTYDEFAAKLCSVVSNKIISTPKGEKNYKKIKIKTGAFAIGLLVIIALVFIATILASIFIKEVPLVIGVEAKPAREMVYEEGFVCSVADDYSDEEEFGYVFKQNKVGNALKNSPVIITTSLGPENDLTVVPAVVGFNITEGVKKLVEADIKSFIIAPVSTKEYQIGYITNQSIPSGYKVSKLNEIVLDVSSEYGSTISVNGQKIKLTDRKVKVTIEEKEVKISPLAIFEFAASYSENVPLSQKISANFVFDLNAKRENTEVYGKYRGNFSLVCSVKGDDSLFWNTAKALVGAKDNIDIIVSSSAFSFTAEEFNKEKYVQFVKDNTGSEENCLYLENPILMVLGDEIPLTQMNEIARNSSKLYGVASAFAKSIPKIEDGYLKLPYSVVLESNGEAWVSFYLNNGSQSVMSFMGSIKYE